ncbi:hypothetical protein MGYG_03193 [Nannizzia gypsea CBS 118893]|uniref:Uncharacterized protein n=1 Tax=Arthroderma gypseum (strain ATCC MYA-4604 / CBS 118893) TaxID=535722 RepID=E4URC5_ARTGP|nr:hypothetical protein MGYG_03193 [Nannizzia gypsea CBS 118893]EFR00188.1 hypothetical protein MGYG_03193 [Nannizzia gypsea CBS 118893]
MDKVRSRPGHGQVRDRTPMNPSPPPSRQQLRKAFPGCRCSSKHGKQQEESMQQVAISSTGSPPGDVKMHIRNLAYRIDGDVHALKQKTARQAERADHDLLKLAGYAHIRIAA